MKRFTIDAFADGHVAVTTLTSIEGGGSAHDRKVRQRQELRGEAPERKWSREDRKIFRHGVKEPATFAEGRIELLPFGSEDIADTAMENDALAEAYTCESYERTFEIDNRIRAFERDPNFCKIRKVKMVVLVNEDGTVEEL